MNLTLNRVESGCFWLKNHIVLAGQLLQQVLFGLGDLLFIFLESLFHVTDPVNHQAPEQFGQLAGQGDVGNQAATAPFESSVEATQRLIDATAHATSDHPEQAAGSVAPTLLATSPFATLSGNGRQAKPRRELLFALPVLTQIGPDFGQQLQQHVISH